MQVVPFSFNFGQEIKREHSAASAVLLVFSFLKHWSSVRLLSEPVCYRHIRYHNTSAGSASFETWPIVIGVVLYCVQVAIKIIDKTQLNPSSLQKVGNPKPSLS